MHAESLPETEEMGDFQPLFTAKDRGQRLRIQTRLGGDRFDRPAGQLDEGADQTGQPPRFLFIGIVHGKSISPSGHSAGAAAALRALDRQLAYSFRIASIGSTRAARRAGSQVARRATAASSAAIPV